MSNPKLFLFSPIATFFSLLACLATVCLPRTEPFEFLNICLCLFTSGFYFASSKQLWSNQIPNSNWKLDFGLFLFWFVMALVILSDVLYKSGWF
jgi:hypothetical protein